MRLAPALLLLVACDPFGLGEPQDAEALARLETAALRFQAPGWHRSECSGVAISPRTMLTAAHCSRHEGETRHVLTRTAWANGGERREVQQARCHWQPCPDWWERGQCDTWGGRDGWCAYRLAAGEPDFEGWLPVGECRVDDHFFMVHNATHSNFARVQGWVTGSEPGWLELGTSPSDIAGASGSGVMCRGRLGGVFTAGPVPGYAAIVHRVDIDVDAGEGTEEDSSVD